MANLFWQIFKYGVIGILATAINLAVAELFAAYVWPCLGSDDLFVKFLGFGCRTGDACGILQFRRVFRCQSRLLALEPPLCVYTRASSLDCRVRAVPCEQWVRDSLWFGGNLDVGSLLWDADDVFVCNQCAGFGDRQFRLSQVLHLQRLDRP